MNLEILEWIKVVGPLIISWPMALLILIPVLRRPILHLVERFTSSEGGKAELGPIKIELGKLAQEGQQAVHKLNRINLLMAESRLLELEITERTFGPMFTSEQRQRMKEHIEELKLLTGESNSLL
jgi:hypothetical protein